MHCKGKSTALDTVFDRRSVIQLDCQKKGFLRLAAEPFKRALLAFVHLSAPLDVGNLPFEFLCLVEQRVLARHLPLLAPTRLDARKLVSKRLEP